MKDRIKQVRQAAGVSQAVFAEKIGLSRNYVAMLEIGQREPSDRTISDICRVFGVNRDWLVTGEGEPFLPLSREEEIAAIFADLQFNQEPKARLIKALARMPDEAFPAFLDFLERFSELLNTEERN